MSTDTLSISKPKAPRLSLDYDALLEHGIRHVESLAGKVWTDYNSHDPGITTLELLCYAITELGYRCDFAIGDVIAPNPNLPTTQSDFFPLSRIATNAPLTVNDYRKLLIDLPGIRNAWLEKAERGETGLYLNLAGTNAPKLLTYSITGSREVALRGLYKVYVQFEEDKDFGDLNDNSMGAEVTLDLVTGNTVFELEIEFPVWENISEELDALDPDTITQTDVELQVGSFVEDAKEAYTYDFDIVINPTGRAVDMPLRARVVSGQENVLNKDDFENNLLGQLDGSLPPIGASEPFLVQLLRQFMKRRVLIQGLLEDVRSALADYRNLCEDFLAIYPMSLQEIGLDLELEVKPGTNCEDVMAQAYRAMENYLSPNIQFYSLREMLEKEYTVDQIFQGPRLENGFIDDRELSFHQRREILYTSDLIQEFMKIDGVTKVKEISLSHYTLDESDPNPLLKLEVKGAEECLKLDRPERFLPRLIYTRSEVRIDDGAGETKVPDRVTALELLRETKALDLLRGANGKTDLPEPEGVYRGLDKYRSLQKDFPINYGIGVEGLAPSEPDLRKAQAHQFKAYLLFFEQLLADFLTQLSSVRRLFSFQEDQDRTYFTQALFDVPNVQNLITDFTNGAVSWEDYRDLVGATDDHYRNQLNSIAEDAATFNDRRTRFLDHLMGRFNESFSEYAAYIFTRNWEEAEQYSTLIGDQVRFLRKYDEHSHDRGTGFNYQMILEDGAISDDFWNSEEVTGLKKRMTYLLGLPKVEREYISPFNHVEIYQDGGLKYRYRIHETDDNSSPSILFGGPGGLNTEDEILDLLEKVLVLGLDASNYVPGSSLRLMDGATVLGTVNGSLISSLGSDAAAINFVIARIQAISQIENFHLIEHILLRPRQAGGATMDVRIDADCPELNIRDPYSFRASVVLPAWSRRFTEIDFRRLFKKIIRMETPAHVYLHFYWVDERQMYHFENCWGDWLEGEWLSEPSYLLKEDSDRVLQETAYNILLEQQGNLGEDGIAFVECMSKLKNLRDAYYIVEPPRIVDQYEDCDLLAYPVDPDGQVIRAWLSDDSPPLPPGVCINRCTGEIRVEDADALFDADEAYQLEILTISSSGETTCHNVTIEFIANGPAKIIVGPLDQHIGKYTLNQVVVGFYDEDGDDDEIETVGDGIIQATLISYVAPPGVPLGTPPGVPPGMSLDLLHGTITVTDPSALEAGSYTLQVKLMDGEGGVTFITFTIVVRPDTEASFIVHAPDSKNEDAYQVGDLIFSVHDADEGIVTVAPSLLSPAFADLGLVMNIGGSPPVANFTIGDLTQFRNALINRFQLQGQHYIFNLKVDTSDVCGGTTEELEIPLKIYRDNTPTITVMAAENQDKYFQNKLLATITDPLDGGLFSATTATDLAAVGIEMVVSLGVVNIQVADVALFNAAVNTVFAPQGLVVWYQFTVDTVDATGGLATQIARVRVLPDQEPEVHIDVPPKDQDLYAQGEVLAHVTDANGIGILSFTLAPGNAPADAGLAASIATDGGGRKILNLAIANRAAFISSIGTATGPWTLIDATTNLYEALFSFRTVDYTGGIGVANITIGVFQDFSGDKIELKNGERITAYSTGDAIWRFKSITPGVKFNSVSGMVGTPPGVDHRIDLPSGEVEIYVSNAAALVQGDYPVQISITNDSNSNTTNFNVDVILRPRLVVLDFEIEYNGQQSYYILDLNAQVPSLEIESVSDSPAPTFGQLYNYSFNWYFVSGSAFPSSVNSERWDFVGLIGNTSEVVEGEIYIKRKNPKDTDTAASGGTVRTSGGSGTVKTGSSTDDKTSKLVSDSNKLLDNLNGGKNYADNPLLKSNPKLIGDYAAGKKDGYVAKELLRLTEETSNEMVRLQNVVLSTTGVAQQEARENLAIYAEIYRQQVLAAVDYAGQIRDGDIAEQGAVKDLFTAIETQMKRIK